ncbi:MAG: AmmeMemoRadiSam system protein B [Patescibacteria group bacterium]|nr:AmmeMemoRadiSam system protein B [Patescibacteria group bacterium]
MRFRKAILALSLTAATAAAVLGMTFAGVPRQEPQTVEDVYGVEKNGVGQDISSAARHSSVDWNSGKPEETIPTSNFIDRKTLSAAWSRMEVVDVPRGAIAGVVNHHVLAAELIAGFFHALKQSAPQTTRIIVISPDHFFSGRGPISVHDRSYATPNGILDSDQAFIDRLVSSTPALVENGAMFGQEHGVGALAPFIKHEFPDARIVSIAMQGTMDRDMSRAFGKSLAGMLDEQTLTIISSDMSHYLPEKTALENDRTTIDKLESLDAAFFSTVKDDYVDNGVGLLALTSLMEELQLEPKFHLVGHGISSDYVSDDRSTTSYINGIWTR